MGRDKSNKNQAKESGPEDNDLKRSRAYLQAVLDNVLDGIISTNEARIVETFNPGAERIFGYAATDVIGRNVKMLMPEPYRGRHDSYVEDYLRTGVCKIIGIGREVTGLRSSGEQFPMDLAVTEMVVEGERRFIGIVRDITGRKKAEQALRTLNEKLEVRIEKRTLMLQEANQALKTSLADLRMTHEELAQTRKMAVLGGLVSGVAHEINTPVGVCVTAASFLELKVGELETLMQAPDADRARVKKTLRSILEATESIRTNLDRAADLIRSFKKVAVDQANEERRRFNLKEYIDMVLLSLRPKYKRTGHQIEVDCPERLEVVGYPGVFSQIITNLVMNSLIHGFEGVEAGAIRLAVSLEDRGCVLTYSDNGIGIPEAHLDQIYDPFFTTRRAQGGSGLGMHIVYNLVTQRLGGTIHCTSTPGGGTTFEIVFPQEADGFSCQYTAI